ncbi:MAG: rhodanese-like domain-containing protein [Pirellulaceae bacterium]|nr:rhodanese-like domain-containing protein [Pirellulaceae bacterium]
MLTTTAGESHAQLGFFSRSKVETISTTDLHAILEKQLQIEADAKQAGKEVPQADFVVVDVRSAAEVNVSIIPGAITKAEHEKNRQRFQDRTVIPYCTVGGRSGAYAKQLAKNGVKVKNYEGSILKWVAAELPLVTLKGEPTNRVHTYSNRYRVPAKYEQVTQ